MCLQGSYIAELAGRALRDLVHGASFIFVPAHIFPDGNILFLIFQGILVSGYHLWTQLDTYPM